MRDGCLSDQMTECRLVTNTVQYTVGVYYSDAVNAAMHAAAECRTFASDDVIVHAGMQLM